MAPFITASTTYHSYQGWFGDIRLDHCVNKFKRSMEEHLSVNVKQISASRAEQKSFYRALCNEKVSEEKMIESLSRHCGSLVSGREVIVISDSSEINLNKHTGRLKTGEGSGVGVVGNNSDAGFFIHPSLVIDSMQGHVLGYSSLQIWTREPGHADKKARNYGRLPIEEKESRRWIEGCRESLEVLSQAAHITFIEDREGDIYQQFVEIPTDQADLLIRSRSNRRLQDGTALYETLQQAPLAGTYELAINGDKRLSRTAREAIIEVRFTPVTIKKPANLKDPNLPDSIPLYAVEAREVNGPGKPVLWRLLTTRAVTTFEQAKDAIDKYKQRWNIEEVFRLLKRKGFQVEDSQLESGWGIRKLTILALEGALNVMQLRMAQDNPHSQPIEEVYSPEEVEFMHVLNPALEGKTELLKNKHDPQKLAWAAWIMGRLAGWGGFPAERKPGVISLKNGRDRFYQLFDGYKLAKYGNFY